MTLSLNQLSQWQKITFCSALLERMLPNYQLFSETTEFGDIKVIRNQLDLLWQWLDKNNRCKINYGAQLVKLESQIPDPEEFDFFGVFPALDLCMALMSLLQSIQDKDEEGFENTARLSINSVSHYVELVLAQDNPDIEITNDMINEHPLMIWELATQQELYNFISSSPENKQTCIKAKALVLEEGMSNLGIEI
ncbi:YjaG family protein [Colwelliaceae bacterium 6471]